jgi:hypothetical protein
MKKKPAKRELESVTIAFMCDAYRQSIHSQTSCYSLNGIMTDVLRVVKLENSAELSSARYERDLLKDKVKHYEGLLMYLADLIKKEKLDSQLKILRGKIKK